MVLGVVRPKMAMDFGPKEVEPMLDEGRLSMDSPSTVMGLLKVRIDGWTENLSMCFACMLLLELNGLKCVWEMIC